MCPYHLLQDEQTSVKDNVLNVRIKNVCMISLSGWVKLISSPFDHARQTYSDQSCCMPIEENFGYYLAPLTYHVWESLVSDSNAIKDLNLLPKLSSILCLFITTVFGGFVPQSHAGVYKLCKRAE
jgi:hypothetical protein